MYDAKLIAKSMPHFDRVLKLAGGDFGSVVRLFADWFAEYEAVETNNLDEMHTRMLYLVGNDVSEHVREQSRAAAEGYNP